LEELVVPNEEEGNEEANSGKSEPLASICQTGGQW